MSIHEGAPSATEKATAVRNVRVAINSELDIVVARQKGRALARELSFSATDLALIATAISELARNVISYARCGEIQLGAVTHNGRQGIVVTAKDEGPGIANLDQAVLDGYSTSGGLGLGLPGVRRLMDEFDIQSKPGSGTTVTVIKWRR